MTESSELSYVTTLSSHYKGFVILVSISEFLLSPCILNKRFVSGCI